MVLKKKVEEKFLEWAKDVVQEGSIDRKTKELMIIAAALASGDKFCAELHIENAKKLGATEEEIQETIAIAMLVSAGKLYCNFAGKLPKEAVASCCTL